MNKLRLLASILLSLLLTASAARAQTSYKVPTGYSFQTADDYAEYEPQVIAAVNWLEKTPLNQEPALRKETDQFLFQWISGSSSVSVQLQKYVADLAGQDSELLMLFMGGWARYQLQHPETKDAVQLNTEGIRTMLRAYQAGGFRRNKQLDELKKLEAAGTLPAWVKKQLAG
ncbi:hypothetical protein [Hymenobacter metallilatus]|uniref:Uncharacterized protein n=1 Tax=Hymenobacter metallilatus TaxID=2493666 RepID=A0A3R9NDS5_9BACT|nr:hypothetical protein [Hymenobacter metallilatus]RSK29589.1 hypothetical protein EI290_17120 [Hymenobacter metallilatus]